MLDEKVKKAIRIALASTQDGDAVIEAIEAVIVSANVPLITSPASATAEVNAGRINDIISSLIAAGIMEEQPSGML